MSKQQNIFSIMEQISEKPAADPVAETAGESQSDTMPACTLNEPAGEQAPDFETMLVDLEKIVKDLEGELKLEQALGLFERGLTLSQDCQKLLQAAEQRIEILKRTASGIQTEPFAEDEI